MKFEDALTALRSGKKIRSPFMDNDEYLIACRHALLPFLNPDKKLTLPAISENIFMTKMKGDFIHPDMKPEMFPACEANSLHLNPQLNMLWIMHDNWEIIE